MAHPSRKPASLVPAAVLALLVLAVFFPLPWHDFVAYDDPEYVAANPAVRGGLTLRGLAWALTSPELGIRAPVAFLSHMADVELYGLRPAGHHLTSLALHLATTLLLFAALRRLTGARVPSFLAAALFAVHPLHVEPVAWVAERKGLLAGLFWALSLLLYQRWLRRPGAGRYLALLAAFLLALLSKPVAVTLPFALLLLDWWPLGRLAPRPGAGSGAAPALARVLAEKAPLLALAAAAAAAAYAAQGAAGALLAASDAPLAERLALLPVALADYLRRSVFPTGLSVIYARPAASAAATIAAAAALALVTAAAVAPWRRRPHLAAGWLWFAGVLLPTAGLVPFGAHFTADRFMYLPLAGLAVAAAWGAVDLASLSPRPARWLAAAACAAAALLVPASVLQVRHWRDSHTLFERAVAVAPGAWMAQHQAGTLAAVEGRHEAALARFDAALALNPGYLKARLNRGRVLAAMGRLDEAAAWFARIAADSGHPDAFVELGGILLEAGRPEEAAAQFRLALHVDPGNAAALEGLRAAAGAGASGGSAAGR